MRPWPRILLYVVLANGITLALLWPAIMAARGGPAVPDWWHALGAIGPAAAALLTLAVARDAGAWRVFGTSLLHWRAPTRVWAMALGVPLGFFLCAWVGLELAGQAQPGVAAIAAMPNPATRLLHALAYGILEEWGWRGLLLPTLLLIMSPLRATLVVFLVWGAWHAPLFFYHFAPNPALMMGFFSALLAGSVLATWLYLASGRSLPVLMGWHATYDVVSVLGAEAAPLGVGIASAMLIPLGLWLARRITPPSPVPPA